MKLRPEKVLITGCGGMLGEAVYPYFAERYEDVLATDKDINEAWLDKLDVRDDELLEQVFRTYRPQRVLHLAAETDLEYCETNPEIAQETNARATKVIAQLCEKYGATLAYISTAGVFDGRKAGFYTEDDNARPIMVYGQTKYDGERYAMEYCSRTFVVRAGWMMGGGRRKEKKFIFKILQQIRNGAEEIFAVDDRWGTPTYTYDFAGNLFTLLETQCYGLYHMVCEGKGTRFDVAAEILKTCKRPDIQLTPVSSEFFKAEYFAPRPYSEMMLNTRLRKLGLSYMRPWKVALKDYIETYFSDYIGVPQEKPVVSVKRVRVRRFQPRVAVAGTGVYGGPLMNPRSDAQGSRSGRNGGQSSESSRGSRFRLSGKKSHPESSSARRRKNS